MDDVHKTIDEALGDGGDVFNITSLGPDGIVEKYFESIREGNDGKATKLFGDDADGNFQTCTVQEYNKTITDLYYGFEKDIPTYPFFEEIRNFNYDIVDIYIDEETGEADVNIDIENCDVTLMAGILLQADSEKRSMDSMSDPELQELFRETILQYKDSCMINTNADFLLKKDAGGGWKIESITPLKDFSTVIVGQADDLVLVLNGEDVEGSDPY